MSVFRGTPGGGRKATLFAAGFCLVGLFLGGAPRVISGLATDQSGSQPAITLVPGPDSHAACATYPCATVSTSDSGKTQISLSLGIDSDGSLQPETYYTDLLIITNPTTSTVTVASVALSGMTATSQSDFGSVTLYYCRAQTNTPQTRCEGSFTATSGAGGLAYQGADELAPGAARYLELSGFAGLGARPGDTLSFAVEVSAG